ncbi:enhancer of rudimentary, putative [Eimeria brunetti]|uniref:Enhancer of rudimentary, putative n=1 Tax=Eimeria brunetti TaxID=51314 RepID=U6LK81_9EIME|nr:enhancer of rudimentary, putative [Eimeria brunetti]
MPLKPGPSPQGHTILLVQFTDRRESRTYLEFADSAAAMDGVCQLYEQGLKASNPHLRHITYDVTDLFNYLDSVRDLCALV